MKHKENRVKLKTDKINFILLFSAYKKAINEVEGLRGLVFRGLLLNYFIFFVVTLILNGIFFYQILNPIINLIFGDGEGIWSSVGKFFLWSIQLTFAAVISLASIRFSVELISLWHQTIVNRIIGYFRQVEEKRFTMQALATDMKYILKEALKCLFSPILLLLVGLIPLIGIPIVFILEAHLLGRQSIVVYLESLTNPDESSELRKIWRWVPIRVGILPAALTFIPFVGWLLLPLTITFEVIGFTYLVEKSRTS